MPAFERDVQLLADFAGLPTFLLLVVEAFVCVVLSRVRAIVLAVFAFVFLTMVGRLAASTQLAAMSVAPALSVAATTSAPVFAVFLCLLLLLLLLCAPSGVRIYQVSALFIVAEAHCNAAS